MPAAQGRCVCLPVSRNASGSLILLCLPGSAEGLRLHPLSEIEKPGSGTEPIHQEHVMCSRFRGSCPSDVKSAGHPEPGFPIPLSGSTAALCAPGETQKNPAARSIPGHRHTHRPLSSGHTQTRGRTPHPCPSRILAALWQELRKGFLPYYQVSVTLNRSPSMSIVKLPF